MIAAFLAHRLTAPLAMGTAILLTFGLVGAGVAVGLEAKRADKAEARTADAIEKITGPNGWAARLEQCRSNERSLNGALSTQNAAVDALKAEGERRTQNSARALQAAQRASRDAGNRITALLNRQPVSSDELEQCREAQKLIRETIR
jgi:hypothetical protein